MQLGCGPEKRITYLNFADDVLRAGGSLYQARAMLDDLIEAMKVGRNTHRENQDPQQRVWPVGKDRGKYRNSGPRWQHYVLRAISESL